MRHKKIKAFLRHSVKTDPACVDETALQELLDQMSDFELRDFWSDFTTSTAFSKASIAVPDWQTSRQKTYLLNELSSYAFHPTTTDCNGRPFRSDLQEHVRSHLINHIDEQRHVRRWEKSRPILAKIHSNIGITFVIMCWLIPVVVIICIFMPEWVQATVEVAYLSLWAMFLLLAIVRSIARR